MRTFLFAIAGTALLPLSALSASSLEPTNANEHVAPAAYLSTFSGYHVYQESVPADWRVLNDAIGNPDSHPENMPAPTATPMNDGESPVHTPVEGSP
ncbi:MAG: hypothetical protein HY308_11640 [Gammaproteobacteria bacterium]|nr:hypothetical protein [Gammaproteobacteria bacterium]